MKLINQNKFIFLIICSCYFGFSQNKDTLNNIKINKNSFYVVCRGTKSKVGFISDFNLLDKNITHVGIGVVEKNKIKVYNVSNEDVDKNNLYIQNLNDFINFRDIKYLSIWELKTSQLQIKKLKQIIKSFTLKKISFDINFTENGSTKLYCSEFCAIVLKKLNSKKYNFKKTKKKLELIYSRSLKRDTLDYYPVDFFQTNNQFNKIYETFY